MLWISFALPTIPRNSSPDRSFAVDAHADFASDHSRLLLLGAFVPRSGALDLEIRDRVAWCIVISVNWPSGQAR